jgi:hypothetical protein
LSKGVGGAISSLFSQTTAIWMQCRYIKKGWVLNKMTPQIYFHGLNFALGGNRDQRNAILNFVREISND